MGHFFKHKQSLREELKEAEADLLRADSILSKIQENPDEDYLVQSALEEGTKMSIQGIRTRINEIKEDLIILEIAQIIVMQDIHFKKLYKKNIYHKLSDREDFLKAELFQIMELRNYLENNN